eukprot:100308-Rhodomonas_salina.3
MQDGGGEWRGCLIFLVVFGGSGRLVSPVGVAVVLERVPPQHHQVQHQHHHLRSQTESAHLGREGAREKARV